MLRGMRPIGLRKRIGAIIVIHALLFAATLALVLSASDGRTDRIYLLPDPERVSAIVLAFERTTPASYPDLVRAFQDDRQEVRLLPSLPSSSAPAIHAEDKAAEADAEPYRRALGGRPFRIETNGQDISGMLDAQPFFSRRPFRVIVGLANGRAVEIQRSTVGPVGKILTHIKLIILLFGLVDVLVIFWLAAQTTAPVERLVRAVREDDPDAMTGSGPREFIELGEAFRAMRARLHAALDERTRIIAAVAHDFRTYLTRLELRSDFIDDPEQRALAARDLAEMRQLMDDALTFARPDAGASGDDGQASFSVAAELERLVRARQQNGEDIRLGLRPGAPMIAQGTAVVFHRMIDNLLDNAMRYGGGHVTVSLAAPPPAQDGEDTNRPIAILIEDDGPGVPEEHLENLTEPFLRLETSRARHTGGVGLGLSIVQALAHRFGGGLRLENRAQGGLRAVLTLRAAPVAP